MPAAIAVAAASTLPAGRDIDELIRLGEIGHVTRILEKLNEIEGARRNAAISSRACARS